MHTSWVRRLSSSPVRPQTPRHLSSIPVRVVRDDLSDRAALQEAVQQVTIIFHCAACSTDWAPLQTYLEANVIGTQNLISAAQRAPKLHRFLHVSTTDIYGYPQYPAPRSTRS